MKEPTHVANASPVSDWMFALSLTASGVLLAQQGGGGNHAGANDDRPVKPTGPAAKKADDLIKAYTGRIEKEIEQGPRRLSGSVASCMS